MSGTWYQALGSLAAGLVLGYAIARLVMPPIFRRHPALLWPEDWLAGRKLRRGRRKMSDPGDRMTS